MVAVGSSGGGRFLVVALVLIETSDVTKTGLTGRLNATVETLKLSSPLSSRPALSSFSFILSLLLY